MNILIVEDEFYTLEELKHYVEKYDGTFNIVISSNPLDALEKFKRQKFEIALLDIELPEMNGIDLAEQLNVIQPDVKISFVTAYNNYAVEAFEIYALDYVLKPVREERLNKCLERLVNSVSKDEPVSQSNMQITTFGGLEVKIKGDIIKWKRQKAKEVFAYLIMNHNRPINKEKICDVIFYDLGLTKALIHLQTAVSHIRSHGIVIDYFDNSYYLRLSNSNCDLVEFEALFANLNDEVRREAFKKIYKGDFLQAEGYVWSLGHQTYLKNEYKKAVR